MSLNHGFIVEESVLRDLQRGSLEESLTLIDSALSEYGDKVCGVPVVPFATYKDRVVVLSEDGQFFNVKYRFEDSEIVFFDASSLKVDVMSEEDVTSRAVDDFYSGDLGKALRGLVEMRSGIDLPPVVMMERRLGSLFGAQRHWQRYLSSHRERFASYVGEGAERMDSEFAALHNGTLREEDLEQHRREVMESLLGMEKKFSALLGSTEEAIKQFHRSSDAISRGDDVETMAQYEAFSSDYLDHLSDVCDLISETVAKDNGCVACAALVHDQLAQRFEDFWISGQFVRKVAEAYTR